MSTETGPDLAAVATLRALQVVLLQRDVSPVSPEIVRLRARDKRWDIRLRVFNHRLWRQVEYDVVVKAGGEDMIVESVDSKPVSLTGGEETYQVTTICGNCFVASVVSLHRGVPVSRETLPECQNCGCSTLCQCPPEKGAL